MEKVGHPFQVEQFRAKTILLTQGEILKTAFLPYKEICAADNQVSSQNYSCFESNRLKLMKRTL